MLFNNLAFLPRLVFFRHGLAFFLKRCLATLARTNSHAENAKTKR